MALSTEIEESRRLSSCSMADLIASEQALQIAISQVERAWALKDRFYQQVLPLLATS